MTEGCSGAEIEHLAMDGLLVAFNGIEQLATRHTLEFIGRTHPDVSDDGRAHRGDVPVGQVALHDVGRGMKLRSLRLTPA